MIPAPRPLPLQVDAAMAAELCAEKSARAFRARVGAVYPRPTARIGGRDLWLTRDLIEAVERLHRGGARDIADML